MYDIVICLFEPLFDEESGEYNLPIDVDLDFVSLAREQYDLAILTEDSSHPPLC